MLKRTLFFVNPCYISVRNKQLIVKDKESGTEKQVPAEDVGFVIIDNKQITFTHSVMQLLASNNTAMVICNESHLPVSIMQNLASNHIEAQNIDYQVSAGEALKKQLWKQTIKQKILNQAGLLKYLDADNEPLLYLASQVKSGDTENRESVAAKIYWRKLFNAFVRDRYGEAPNNMLNYGYAILRAATAKAISGSGLLPALGIHHHNKYNSYRLADDLMEPYRPYVDAVVIEIFRENPAYPELTTDVKIRLLEVLTMDTKFRNVKRPLSVGLSMTTASLVNCFRGKAKKISYPEF